MQVGRIVRAFEKIHCCISFIFLSSEYNCPSLQGQFLPFVFLGAGGQSIKEKYCSHSRVNGINWKLCTQNYWFRAFIKNSYFSLLQTKKDLESCMDQWELFDSKYEECSAEVKQVENKLKGTDLKNSLEEKEEQLNILTVIVICCHCFCHCHFVVSFQLISDCSDLSFTKDIQAAAMKFWFLTIVHLKLHYIMYPTFLLRYYSLWLNPLAFKLFCQMYCLCIHIISNLIIHYLIASRVL